MGENLDAGGRNAVRTPMQWSDTPTGGFSNAEVGELCAPLPPGPFGPEHVNVMQQRHDQGSLLNFIKTLIDRYRTSVEIGWSDVHLLRTEEGDTRVLAHELHGDEGRMLAFHNFSPESLSVHVRLEELVPGSVFADLLQEGHSEADQDGVLEVRLDGYGYRWLRVLEPDTKRLR